MTLSVNMLLEWPSASEETRIDRVLWLDPSGTDGVTIQINCSDALPAWQKCHDLYAALAAGEARVLTVDPYAVLLRPETTIPEAHRQRRDDAWDTIASIVEGAHGQVFLPSVRGQLIAAAIRRTGKSKVTIYQYLRRYWQGGQTPNALLPLFDQCGGRGKEKRSRGGKLGRPSQRAAESEPLTTVIINENIRERFRRGIQRFYESPQGQSLRAAYQRTLEHYFNVGYEMRDGVLVPVLPAAGELPSFKQFRYWYEKDRDVSQALQARAGKRQFELRHRAVLGDSTRMAFGPGSLYQIDATIGDIYLVSSLDRSRIIGRPVIYVIVDVFSRLITGLGIGLEGPSWLGAMLALENAAADKVAFCREYGLAIEEGEWPAHHLPEAILADRGELEGFNADHIVYALNIKISNTPPYRADWKGIVERNFRLSNDRLIHWMPGAVYRPRERGDKDYRLDATLDLHQFRKLMILCALDHNRHHRMDWYRLDEFMIQDHVDPYPIDLWNWGIVNRVGHLRTEAPNILRVNLLPEGEASVTYRGLRFQGLLYTCELALREQWFIRAREKGTWRIPVAYDPRRLDHVYLRLDGGKRIELCALLHGAAFGGRDWHEALDYFELQKQARETAKTRDQEAKAVFHARVEQVIEEATEQTEQALGNQSKRSRIRGIRENRALERAREREKGTWRLAAAESPAEVIPIGRADKAEEADDGYVPPPQDVDKIRKLREKMRNHES